MRSTVMLKQFCLSLAGVLIFISFAQAADPNSFSAIKINGVEVGSERVDIGSPFIILDASYQLADDMEFRNLRIYSNHSCSIAEKKVDITWCGSDNCRIGGQGDFDVSFESNGELYHVFQTKNRDVDFSIELNTIDSFGAVVSQCKDVSLHLDPCDRVLETTSRKEGDDNIIEIDFVDSKTKQPVDGVELLISSGPVPVLSRPKPGKLLIHTVPKKDKFKFSVSRSQNHRFVVGPFKGQYVKDGLKKLKLSLCGES